MSERNHPSSFDYEFIGSTDGAAVLNDGEQINLPHQNQYRTEGLEKPGTQYEPYTKAVRYERPPTEDELKAERAGELAKIISEGLRANYLANQNNVDLAAGE
jgi:hypothetical protein